MQTLLLTRPLEQSRRFAALARLRLGPVPVMIAPLMAIRHLPLPESGADADGLIVTSSSALSAWKAGGGRLGMAVCCVGKGTARRAEEAGLRVVLQAADAQELALLLAGGPRSGRWLWLRGRHVARDLAAQLAGRMQVAPAIVYEQISQPLSEEARGLLDRAEGTVIPVFSPRSASALAEAIGNPSVPPALVAISAATAAALRAASPRMPMAGIAVAASPDGAGMLDALAAHYAAAGMG